MKKLFEGKNSLSYKVIYRENRESIDSLFSFNDLSYKEKIWLLLNDKKEPKMCEVCNIRRSKFIKYSKGYASTCWSKACLDEIRRKSSIKTFIEKYGVSSSNQVPSVLEKRKETNLKKYGNEVAMNSAPIKTKTKEMWIKKYGVDNPAKAESVKKRIAKTNVERFGVDNIFKSKAIRSKIAANSKETTLEKKVKEFLTNRNIHFSQQYVISNTIHTHTFDFAIFDNNNLTCLIDADGEYYHGYLDDQNGKKVFTEYDITRTDFIPDGVKFVIVLENDFDNTIREVMNSINMNYDDYVEDLFQWCRTILFPYPSYQDTILNKSYSNLQKYNYFYDHSQVGFKIIRHFHKSIYSANVYGKLSPREAWNDDTLLINAIKNRIIYKNNIDPSRILDGFSISKIAPKVSVFQPSKAKELIIKYLPETKQIFDPFSGFSGRMLGSCSLNKEYIGQDINKNHVLESNEIVKYLNLNARVIQQNIFSSNGKYESLFTCSPYNLKEQWNNNDSNLSCDEWITECLIRFNCEKYVFVVDKTEKYKEFVVDKIVNRSHFGKNIENVIMISR